MSPSVPRKVSAELEELLQGRHNFFVHISKRQLAASLWDYGEDELAQQALLISDEDLEHVQAIAAWYEDPSYPLPMSGQNITHRHVDAFAAITFYEGEVRPLVRTRRRPEKNRPAQYQPEPVPRAVVPPVVERPNGYAMESISWPEAWQSEARAALMRFIGVEDKVEILVGDPRSSLGGTLLGGYVYLQDSKLMIIHDRSGRPYVYPSALFGGPVLEIVELSRPRRRSIYRHPHWSKPRRA
ncbi:hypothetical protein ACX80L_05280 [Arthrobacter sp. MDT1-48-3]